MIRVEQVSKLYRGSKVVENVSLHVKEGEIFSIIGTSGAGKTALMELLLGLSPMDEGKITILGYDVQTESAKIKNFINFFMRSTSLIEKMTVFEALKTFQSLYNRKKDIPELLNLFQLKTFAHKEVKRLSGGLRQLTMLAIAAVNDPRIIFLDEPTTGLDGQAKRQYWSLLNSLRQAGKTIVIISHDLTEIHQYSNQVAVMKAGKVMQCGSPSQLIKNLPGGGLTMEAVYMHYAVEKEGRTPI
ncbi:MULTISPECIES: ABC transporter ATP-binding protein [unclassified Paenibacillus]|uniref:ABC transporter ATP-binding protein n=1 Tax=unclassified Paenibacillus TaxID=185978 RepID=UPI002F40C061